MIKYFIAEDFRYLPLELLGLIAPGPTADPHQSLNVPEMVGQIFNVASDLDEGTPAAAFSSDVLPLPCGVIFFGDLLALRLQGLLARNAARSVLVPRRDFVLVMGHLLAGYVVFSRASDG